MSMASTSSAAQVIAVCEKEWDSHKSDCSGFVRAVAADLGIHLTGQAGDIVQFLRANWPSAKDGVNAAQRAADGMFVVGGREDRPHGHVVVVVQGALNRGKYPTAYWGQLGGVGKKNVTINWSWPAGDRDEVEYYYHDFSQARKQPQSSVQARYIGWSLEQLEKLGKT